MNTRATEGLAPVSPPDWQRQQMIKASGWPLSPDDLAAGRDPNLPAEGGLVPWHWACAEGKHGWVKLMLSEGADPLATTPEGTSMLELAIEADSFHTAMLLIDALKARGAPLPHESLRKRLEGRFAKGHVNQKNRLLQTMRDWARVTKHTKA